MTGPVDEDNPNTQGAQNRKIKQDVGEVRRGCDFSIDRNHEDFFAEPRYVLQNFPQVTDIHR